jgi:hypothetical protein
VVRGSTSSFGVLGLLGERGGCLDVGISHLGGSDPVIRVRVRCFNAYVCLFVCLFVWGVGGGAGSWCSVLVRVCLVILRVK